MQFFLEFLQSHIRLKSNLQEYIKEISHIQYYKAGTPILSPGEIQQNIYFIQEGVIRAYSAIDEFEWTSWFFSKGEFAVSPDSFIFGNRSIKYLETCCPTALIAIPGKDYYTLLEKHTELKMIVDYLTQYLFKQGKDRIFNLSHMSASERYKEFVSQHKYITDRVQGQHLASFLGTNAESISRFRKKNAQNKS